MPLPHSFHPVAEQEFIVARTRYDSAAEDLGLDFYLRVRGKIALICENPNLFPVVARKPAVHKAVLDRFPYAIFYTIESDHVTVVSVYHGKRHPRGWRRRLKDPG